MKTLVTYVSLTGNTKRIADAIYETIPEEKEIKPLEEIKELKDYDLIFIGFPVHQMGPPPKAKEFVESKAKGRKIALFVTHASPPGAPLLEHLLTNCITIADESDIVGFFNCQGVLAQEVADMLLKMDDPKFQQFGKMRHITVGHPNAEEIENACNFAEDICKQIKI